MDIERFNDVMDNFDFNIITDFEVVGRSSGH
jgi:hypothetical protein